MHRELIIKALENYRGDNYKSALIYFQNRDMTEQFGNWLKTCAEVLAEYKTHNDAIDEATDWVECHCN